MRITLEHADSDAATAVTPCRTLREYVLGLVHRLAEAEPTMHDRLREVTGNRSARIRLDGETVLVRFDGPTLVVLDADPTMPSNGVGGTDRATTLDLLAGRIEVTDAILAGRLDATGEIEDLVRIFQAIEILLDGATRIPSLQHYALDYGTDPCRPMRAPIDRYGTWRRMTLDPDSPSPGEVEMLRRLDLLP
jgi:hypothetical protein